MEVLALQKKKISINFSKAKTRFCLRLHCNSDNSYLFVNGKEICRFKANNDGVDFQPQFWLGSISNKFSYTEAEEVSLKDNAFAFSIDYGSIAADDILDIQEYLMKKMIGFVKQIFISTLMFFGCDSLNFVSTNNQECKVRPEAIIINFHFILTALK